MATIFDKSVSGRKGVALPICDVPCTPCIPEAYQRKTALPLAELSELDVVRHFTNLSRKNFGVDTGFGENFVPAGFCLCPNSKHKRLATCPSLGPERYLMNFASIQIRDEFDKMIPAAKYAQTLHAALVKIVDLGMVFGSGPYSEIGAQSSKSSQRFIFE